MPQTQAAIRVNWANTFTDQKSQYSEEQEPKLNFSE